MGFGMGILNPVVNSHLWEFTFKCSSLFSVPTAGRTRQLVRCLIGKNIGFHEFTQLNQCSNSAEGTAGTVIAQSMEINLSKEAVLAPGAGEHGGQQSLGPDVDCGPRGQTGHQSVSSHIWWRHFSFLQASPCLSQVLSGLHVSLLSSIPVKQLPEY